MCQYLHVIVASHIINVCYKQLNQIYLDLSNLLWLLENVFRTPDGNRCCLAYCLSVEDMYQVLSHMSENSNNKMIMWLLLRIQIYFNFKHYKLVLWITENWIFQRRMWIFYEEMFGNPFMWNLCGLCNPPKYYRFIISTTIF